MHLSRLRIVIPALTVVAVLSPSAGPCQESGQASLPSGLLRHRDVRDIRPLKTPGGRLDWSAQGDWIAFDSRDEEGFYDIFLMKPDASLTKCLTCQVYDFRKKNLLNPTWHPSGQFLVFQVQSVAKRLDLDAKELATPYRALHSELWAIRRDGREAWQLTRVTETGGAVLDPHFSHEGDRLLWSERVTTKVGRWGGWLLRVGEFRIRSGLPSMRKVRTYRLGNERGLIVGHSFSANDLGVYLAANLEPDQAETGMDIYLLDLETEELDRLTHTRYSWDEHAHLAPNGSKLAWTSESETRDRRGSHILPVRDLWIMNLDGSEKERLTFFNHPQAPEYLGEAVVADFAWSPEGHQIALQVIRTGADAGEAIYLLELSDVYRRKP